MIATTVLDQIKGPLSSSPVSTSNGTGISSKCAICGDAAHGFHFGVSACRACAAFFRRSTISNRKYQCRFGGNCDVGKDVRCCCRACRMAKCLSLGMNAEAVQRHRDHIGPRKRREDSIGSGDSDSGTANRESMTPSEYPTLILQNGNNDVYSPTVSTSYQMPVSFVENAKTYAVLRTENCLEQPSTSTPMSYATSIVSPNSAFTAVAPPLANPQDPLGYLMQNPLYAKLNLSQNMPMPLLSEVSRGYKKLCSLRKTTNRLRQEAGLMKLFDDNLELTEGTYNDNVTTIKNDLSLVSEMISDHFIPLARFSVDAKWLLLRNYFSSFICAERSVNTSRMFPNKEDARMLISCQHYINLRNMDKFFDVPGCKGTPREVASIFEKTFMKMKTLVVNVIIDLQLSDDEVAGLFCVLFWSDVVEGLTSEEEALLLETRDASFEELYFACRCRVSTVDELGIRFGKICNLIPVLKRMTVELSEDFSVVNILNIFDIDTFLHKLLPNSF
uniref:Uncharacterized protein n=2 Tax=Panagrolaimus sp. JU765 TaxID=591449 RepID=A0AC34R2R2_9BILA